MAMISLNLTKAIAQTLSRPAPSTGVERLYLSVKLDVNMEFPRTQQVDILAHMTIPTLLVSAVARA